MNPNVLRLVGTLVAVGLAVLAQVGVVPVDSDITNPIATLVVGWLNLRQPGTIKVS